MKLFKQLKNPTHLLIFLGVSFIFFDLNYYFISKLPGEVDNACVIGANITPVNVGFAVILSLLAGLMVVGGIALHKQRRARMAVSSILSGFGVLVGTFTVFCTVCTLPVISLFGLSLGLGFFTSYNLTFKIISLLLMLMGMYLLEKQLEGECVTCRM